MSRVFGMSFGTLEKFVFSEGGSSVDMRLNRSSISLQSFKNALECDLEGLSSMEQRGRIAQEKALSTNVRCFAVPASCHAPP